MPHFHFTAQKLDQPTRIDRVIRTQFPQWGRRAVQRLVNAGDVQINERKVWLCSWKVRNGDRIAILNPPAVKMPPPSQFDDAWIIADTSDLIAINKPAGLLSHATRWTKTDNLLDLANTHFGGPVTLFHRLDRDTSGVILLARNSGTGRNNRGDGDINRYLDKVFKARLVQKEYIAVIPAINRLGPTGTITARLDAHPKRRDMMSVVKRAGKRAVTHYAIVDERDGKQWIKLWPETGRTHQLRVHLAHMDAPILGDRLYGTQRTRAERLMLHARHIILPAVGDFPARAFSAPTPHDF